MTTQNFSLLQIGDSPLYINKRNKAFWEIIINNPPLNILDPELYDGFEHLLDLMESNRELKVIVFKSAVENFFMAHFDTIRGVEILRKQPLSGIQAWTDITQRLFHSDVISIASVRGRARGVGMEFIAACDMCFASKEKTVFGQMEVGVGTLPGGGNMENLPLQIGRSRALELIIGADDFNADIAELYGFINRALPDDELDDFVDGLATRISQYDKYVVSKTKKMINKRTIAQVKMEDLVESRKVFVELSTRLERIPVLQKMKEWGMQQEGDFELNMGEYLGKV